MIYIKRKRILDVIISTVLLIILLPLFICIIILIKIITKGPIFFKWHVIGKNGKPFTGYKFRTMIANTDHLKVDLLESNEKIGRAYV